MGNSIRFDIRDHADGMIPATRIGGIPDVDSSFVWPRYGKDSRPLSFLAQFECAALGLEELPPSGILSFFYDIEDQPWHTAEGARVFWFPDTDALHPADVPEDLESGFRLPAMDIVFQKEGGNQNLMSKLLGIGDPIQDSVEEECAYGNRKRGIGKWRLLLQLDSIETDGLSLLFSDMGCIYFLVPEKDLAHHRFDRTFLILQSC